MTNCLAIVPLEGAGIEIFTGILNFFSEIKDKPYRIHLCENIRKSTIRMISGDDYDGFIITETGSEATMGALSKTAKPVVLVNITNTHLSMKPRNIVSLWIDNHDIGRLGARHFLAQNIYKSFGFVGLESSIGDMFYSHERESAFRLSLKDNGIASSCFPEKGGDYSDTALKNWISHLQKPAAVMTVNDITAVRVLNCCKTLGFPVPNQVSILGVDDVRPLTEGEGRSLSSVRPDFGKMGYIAAKELVRMLMRHRPSRFKEIVLPVNELVIRKSTVPAKECTKIVDQAIRFIDERAAQDITPNDVAHAMGKSRRLLDIRFHETRGISLNQAIENERIRLCKEMLSQRSKSLATIAASLHFKSTDHLRRYFRHHSGMSITQFKSSTKFHSP